MARFRKMFTLCALAAASAATASDGAGVTFSKPAEKTPGCIAEEMRLPREVAERVPQQLHVWFTVREDGSVADIRTPEVSLPLATQIRGAFSRCAWTAAADEAGRPIAVAATLPIRFEVGSGPGAEGALLARIGTPSYTRVAVASR